MSRCSTTSQSLAAFKEAASRAPETLSPGESPAIAPQPAPSKSAAAAAAAASFDSNRAAATNVGAIVGGVLGGVAVLVVLATVLVLPAMRRKSTPSGSILKGTIGKPQLQLRGGYGAVEPWL